MHILLFVVFLLLQNEGVLRAQDRPPDSLLFQDASISLERGPCFGFCPTYIVTVHGNGDIEFQGSNGMKNAEKHEARIHASEAQTLIAYAVYTVRFDTLRAIYSGNIDNPERIITLRIGGIVKSVSNSSDGQNILTGLETMIDTVAATSRWLAKQP